MKRQVRKGLTVDVGGAPVVVARHKGVKRRDTICVSRLHAAEGGSHQDRGIVGVAHARVPLNTNVDALPRVSPYHNSNPRG